MSLEPEGDQVTGTSSSSLPETDLARIHRWVKNENEKIPPHAPTRFGTFSRDWTDRERLEDERVRIAFLPLKDLGTEARSALTNVKTWLRFAASESRDARAHHSFKHGVSVRPGAPQLALYSKDQDPRVNPSGEPVVEWSGEALVYLSSVKQPDKQRAWVMEHRKLQVVHRLGVIFLVQRFINTLLSVGELRYLDRRPTKDVYLPPVSFEEFVEKGTLSSAPASAVTAFAVPIGWFDAPPAKRPGRTAESDPPLGGPRTVRGP